MITLTPIAAQDLMNAQFNERFNDGQVLSLIGYLPVIYWGGVEKAQRPDSTKYYVRVSHQTVLSRQANLSNCEGLPGQKRYRTSGLTFVQVFGPTSDNNVARNALGLATICRNAFRGAYQHTSEDAIWFYRARINELPKENDLYRLNVIAEHEYDELG